MEQFIEVLTILIAAIKSGIMYMIFIIKGAATPEASLGYFILFAGFFIGSIVGAYYLLDVILSFLYKIFNSILDFFAKGFQNFWNLFKSKPPKEIVTSIANVDYERINKLVDIKDDVRAIIKEELKKHRDENNTPSILG